MQTQNNTSYQCKWQHFKREQTLEKTNEKKEFMNELGQSRILRPEVEKELVGKSVCK